MSTSRDVKMRQEMSCREKVIPISELMGLLCRILFTSGVEKSDTQRGNAG